MNKLFVIGIVSIFIGFALFGGPVTDHGDLQLIDKGGDYGLTICDENGNPYQLKGFSQLDLKQYDTEWVVGATIPNIVDLSGCNAVRLAMYTYEGSWGYMNQDATGKAAYRQKIKDLILDAINADIYVLVDWHILNDPNPWSSEYYTEARAFFEDIAQTYGSYDNVLFELCNEPLDVSFVNTIKPFAEHLLAGIRPYSDNIATVGTPRWSQDVESVVGNMISTNVGRGVLYNIHFYAATHRQELRAKGNTARAGGVPIIISEFGTVDASGNGTLDLTESGLWLDWAATHNYSWFNWSLSIRNETSAAIANGSLSGPWQASNFSTSGQWILGRLPGGGGGGVDAPVPGQIEAEAYSSMSGIQTEATSDVGGGMNVGYIDAGDYLEYNIDAAASGVYTVEYRVASLSGSTGFNLKSGSSIIDTQTIPNTGNWQGWTTISGSVNLNAGSGTLRIEAVGGGWNINWIRFSSSVSTSTPTPTSTYTPTPAPSATPVPTSTPAGGISLPGLVQVEDYNSYYDTTSANEGGAYRTDGVDIEACLDTGGGYNIGWTKQTEWLEYNVNVAASGTYDMDVRVASDLTGGAFHIAFDGINVTGTVVAGYTGGWQNWTTVTVSGVSLTAGGHVMRLYMEGSNFNINSINIKVAGAPTPTSTPTPTPTPTQAPTPTPTPGGDPGSSAANPFVIPSSGSYTLVNISRGYAWIQAGSTPNMWEFNNTGSQFDIRVENSNGSVTSSSGATWYFQQNGGTLGTTRLIKIVHLGSSTTLNVKWVVF